MKDVIIAAAALAAIILARIIISFAWSPHAGEIFCRFAVPALFFCCVVRLAGSRKRRTKQEG